LDSIDKTQKELSLNVEIEKIKSIKELKKIKSQPE
jgi:hypothetical protein